MMTKLSAIALAALISAISSNAISKQYGVLGVGNRSCGAWTSDRKDNGWPTLVELSWVEGFITAMDNNNAKINTAMHATDSDGIASWIDNYCVAHPLDSLSAASEALAIEMATHH